MTAGPYRFVRHPSYTGVLLAFVGIGVMVGNVLSIAALLILPTGGASPRSTPRRCWSRRWGGRYTVYAEGRKRLVPGLW